MALWVGRLSLTIFRFKTIQAKDHSGLSSKPRPSRTVWDLAWMVWNLKTMERWRSCKVSYMHILLVCLFVSSLFTDLFRLSKVLLQRQFWTVWKLDGLGLMCLFAGAQRGEMFQRKMFECSKKILTLTCPAFTREARR